MAFHEAHPFLVAAGLALPTFLLAAKAHGRQIRIEREFEGYPDADFRSDQNPAWVRALWRRDRIQFWTTYSIVAAFLGIGVWLKHRAGAGAWGTEPAMQDVAGSAAIVLLLWTPIVAFTGNGVTSLARWLRRRRRSPEPTSNFGAAFRRSLAYWIGVLVLMAVLAAQWASVFLVA